MAAAVRGHDDRGDLRNNLNVRLKRAYGALFNAFVDSDRRIT